MRLWYLVSLESDLFGIVIQMSTLTPEEKRALGSIENDVMDPRDYHSLGLDTAPVDRNAARQSNISTKKQLHALGPSLMAELGKGRRRRRGKKTVGRRRGGRKTQRRLR